MPLTLLNTGGGGFQLINANGSGGLNISLSPLSYIAGLYKRINNDKYIIEIIIIIKYSIGIYFVIQLFCVKNFLTESIYKYNRHFYKILLFFNFDYFIVNNF